MPKYKFCKLLQTQPTVIKTTKEEELYRPSTLPDLNDAAATSGPVSSSESSDSPSSESSDSAMSGSTCIPAKANAACEAPTSESSESLGSSLPSAAAACSGPTSSSESL